MDAEALKHLLGQPAALFGVMLLASLLNGMKQIKQARDAGGDVTLKAYLRFWPETVGAVAGNVIAFLVLVVSDQLNFASALGIGYGVNSAADFLRPGGRSDAVANKTDSNEKQGGYVHGSMLAVLLAIALPASLFVLASCTGTQAAYHEAKASDPCKTEQTVCLAYTVGEHYAAVLHEAALLKAKPGTAPELIAGMQRADLAVQPAIDRLRTASDAYSAIANAQTQAELQTAVDNAIVQLSELIRAVNAARGHQ